ncbi:hypothetical protein [Idiomarina sp. OXR-189]|uniref:hypothetical protein n=1 Tax=Idiomarina sp. OXR-189 TaxID=3100175 RepID=UPI002AC9C947|nr:hypothetical protein [Idiomarina sp. OXR-189]WPZ00155.1 hypothetical protein UM402_06505 [Idiomarina sp. OXR-189]
MILRLIMPTDIINIHQAMHRETTHPPNYTQLFDVCEAIDREYCDSEVNLDSVFFIAAEYGVRLTHSYWTEDTNRAAETAFAVTMLFLNQYGIPMRGDNQILFNVMRDDWTTADKFAPRLMREYAQTIIDSSEEYLTAGNAFKVAEQSMQSPIRFGPITRGLESLRKHFTVSGCKGIQWDNLVND